MSLLPPHRRLPHRVGDVSLPFGLSRVDRRPLSQSPNGWAGRLCDDHGAQRHTSRGNGEGAPVPLRLPLFPQPAAASSWADKDIRTDVPSSVTPGAVDA